MKRGWWQTLFAKQEIGQDAWKNIPIDAVIMWVDGSDPDFIKSHDSAQARLAGEKSYFPDLAGRHRDSGELLFLLRSIRTFIPWVRTIHIVTNGQVPAYVDFSAEGIKHISHRDIFPDERFLPNFNTFAIDSCVHRIEGLSEHFIRFSDDFFLGRPLTPAEVMGPSPDCPQFIFGGKVQRQPSNAYQTQVSSCAAIFAKKTGISPPRNPAHAPQPRRRSVSERMVSTFEEAVSRTLSHAFRNEGDMIPLFLYPYFALFDEKSDRLKQYCKSGSAEHCLTITESGNDTFRQIYLGDHRKPWKEDLAHLLRSPPSFFNVNDHLKGKDMQSDQAFARDILCQHFSNPSPYEVRDVAQQVFGIQYV